MRLGKAELKEDLYFSLPACFDSGTGVSRFEAVMKVNKSLYGLVKAPLYWYNHFKNVFESKEGFKASKQEPYMFYGRGMVVLCYVDTCLFFGPDQGNIDEYIKELKDSGMALTVEDGVYTFLSVEVKTNKATGKVTLTKRIDEECTKNCRNARYQPQTHTSHNIATWNRCRWNQIL
jgi:hypothetical protein